MSVLVDRLAVIGVGLIGGSFALALKEAGVVNFVMGCGRTEANLQEALARGLIDDAVTNPVEAVRDADVVFLSVPVRSMALLAREIGHALKPGAIVTDAGSTKEIVLGELFAWLPPYVHVVAGHPLAGSEKSGAAAARPDLFRGRRVILIEDPRTDQPALELVRRLWESTGAKVDLMGAEQHDRVLAAVSHLPHLIAYALTDTILEWDRELPMIRFAAGGLRDFTRVAASSPEMWRDICVDNAAAIVEAIDRYLVKLQELRAQVEAGDGEALFSRFSESRKLRQRMEEEEKK